MLKPYLFILPLSVFSLLQSHKFYFGHPLHSKSSHQRAAGYDPYVLKPEPKLLPTFT